MKELMPEKYRNLILMLEYENDDFEEGKYIHLAYFNIRGKVVSMYLFALAYES